MPQHYYTTILGIWQTPHGQPCWLTDWHCSTSKLASYHRGSLKAQLNELPFTACIRKSPTTGWYLINFISTQQTVITFEINTLGLNITFWLLGEYYPKLFGLLHLLEDSRNTPTSSWIDLSMCVFLLSSGIFCWKFFTDKQQPFGLPRYCSFLDQ